MFLVLPPTVYLPALIVNDPPTVRTQGRPPSLTFGESIVITSPGCRFVPSKPTQLVTAVTVPPAIVNVQVTPLAVVVNEDPVNLLPPEVTTAASVLPVRYILEFVVYQLLPNKR